MRYLPEGGIVTKLRSSFNQHHVAVLFAGVLLLTASFALAQNGSMSPYQGEQDGVSAGGKWTEFRSDDKMTGAKRVRFELLSNNFFREDPNYAPRVILYCEAG